MATARHDDNSDDVGRTEQLTRLAPLVFHLRFYQFKLIVRVRSLEDIEKRSMELLGKGKAARILDKKRDSGMIVKLVEEIRQAIIIYQVGPAGNHRRR